MCKPAYVRGPARTACLLASTLVEMLHDTNESTAVFAGAIRHSESGISCIYKCID
jgi:hypothetical protein